MKTNEKNADVPAFVKTGNGNLDDILGGGLRPNRVYLLQGNPGVGKTTLSLQFLMEGSRNGEASLYLTLSESRQELLAVAQSHGWALAGIEIFELLTEAEELNVGSQYTMYQPSEIELGATTATIIGEIERVKPLRIVLDSLSELKLLAQNPLRFRRQILALKNFLSSRNCTVLFLDDNTSTGVDNFQLESIAHGVIEMDQVAPEYGAERRRVQIKKYRGGYHNFNNAGRTFSGVATARTAELPGPSWRCDFSRGRPTWPDGTAHADPVGYQLSG